MKIIDFWDVSPGSLVDHCHHFVGDCRLHGITPLKTAIFMVTEVRTTHFMRKSNSCHCLYSESVTLQASADGNCSQHPQSGSFAQVNKNKCFSHPLSTQKNGLRSETHACHVEHYLTYMWL
jgi:hypothetical protein